MLETGRDGCAGRARGEELAGGQTAGDAHGTDWHAPKLGAASTVSKGKLSTICELPVTASNPHWILASAARQSYHHPRPTVSIPTPIFLAGPTASGKSAVALALAERIGGEIISVDSMQVYRGLDIGTAKPPEAERRRVPHHLIDVAEPAEPFDAAKFVSLAARAVEEIQRRGKAPIFCGGTGLYFKAYLYGLGDAPPGDPKLRAELETKPPGELLEELQRRDPETFDRIDRLNPRRVVRAVEILRLTGKPLSSSRADWQTPLTRPAGTLSPHPMKGEERGEGSTRPPARERVYVLRREQGDLTQRINRRVDEMFARGLIGETRQLLERGLTDNATAMQAIGYRQVVAHLRGELPLAETVELVKRRTRQFARRQMTWFRHQLPCEWLDVGTDAAAEEVADELLRRQSV
jgi:tRNA dimethylallyltransferase